MSQVRRDAACFASLFGARKCRCDVMSARAPQKNRPVTLERKSAPGRWVGLRWAGVDRGADGDSDEAIDQPAGLPSTWICSFTPILNPYASP